jgi:hypothetical protein
MLMRPWRRGVAVGALALALAGGIFALAQPEVTRVDLLVVSNTGAAAMKLAGGLQTSGGTQILDTTGKYVGTGAVTTSQVFSWVVKTPDTVFQAASDGFVVAIGNGTSPGWIGTMTIHTDASNPPTTARQVVTITNDFKSIMCPVKKSDFYKVTSAATSGTATVTVYWVPLGTAG